MDIERDIDVDILIKKYEDHSEHTITVTHAITRLFSAEMWELFENVLSSIEKPDEYFKHEFKTNIISIMEKHLANLDASINELAKLVEAHIREVHQWHSTTSTETIRGKKVKKGKFVERCESLRLNIVAITSKIPMRRTQLVNLLERAIVFRPLIRRKGVIYDRSDLEPYLQSTIHEFNEQFQFMYLRVRGLKPPLAAFTGHSTRTGKFVATMKQNFENAISETRQKYNEPSFARELRIRDHYDNFLAALNVYGAEQFMIFRHVSSS